MGKFMGQLALVSSCALLLACGGQDLAGAEVAGPTTAVPAGAEYLGHIDSVGKLPPDRLVAIMENGDAFLLRAADYSRATGAAERAEPVPSLDAPSVDDEAVEVSAPPQQGSPVSICRGSVTRTVTRLPSFRTVTRDHFNGSIGRGTWLSELIQVSNLQHA